MSKILYIRSFKDDEGEWAVNPPLAFQKCSSTEDEQYGAPLLEYYGRDFPWEDSGVYGYDEDEVREMLETLIADYWSDREDMDRCTEGLQELILDLKNRVKKSS